MLNLSHETNIAFTSIQRTSILFGIKIYVNLSFYITEPPPPTIVVGLLVRWALFQILH